MNHHGTIILGLLLLCSAGVADTLVYEGFDYTTGQSVVGQNGGSGFSAAWAGDTGWTVAASDPGSAINGLTTGGGALQLGGSNGSRVARRLDTTYTIGTGVGEYSELWVSTVIAQNGPIYVGHAFGLELRNGGNTVAAVGKKINGRYGIWTNLGNGDGVVASGMNTTSLVGNYFYVMKLEASGSDTLATLYAVKDSETYDLLDPSTYDHTATYTFAGGLTFNGVGSYRWNNEVTQLDEIRIGTSVGDVVANVVPEPATMGLLLVGGVGLLRRKRNK